MIAVAAAIILSTAVGAACQRNRPWAREAAHYALRAMLCVITPIVAFATIAHLTVTAGAEVGLGLAYVAVATAGAGAWLIGHRCLHLCTADLGALICSVISINSGSLGLPVVAAQLGPAVAFDQLVGTPILFVGAFAVGAACDGQADSGSRRLRAFLGRNPPLLAALLGLVLPASAAPHVLLVAAHLLVYLLIPLGFFAVGVNLSGHAAGGITGSLGKPTPAVLVVVGLRVFGATAILAALSLAVPQVPTAYFLQMSMASAVATLIIGQTYRLNQRLIASSVVWTTALVLIAAVVIAVD